MRCSVEGVISVGTGAATAWLELMLRERAWREDGGEVLAFSVGEEEEEWEGRREWECFVAGLGD